VLGGFFEKRRNMSSEMDKKLPVGPEVDNLDLGDWRKVYGQLKEARRQVFNLGSKSLEICFEEYGEEGLVEVVKAFVGWQSYLTVLETYPQVQQAEMLARVDDEDGKRFMMEEGLAALEILPEAVKTFGLQEGVEWEEKLVGKIDFFAGVGNTWGLDTEIIVEEINERREEVRKLLDEGGERFDGETLELLGKRFREEQKGRGGKIVGKEVDKFDEDGWHRGKLADKILGMRDSGAILRAVTGEETELLKEILLLAASELKERGFSELTSDYLRAIYVVALAELVPEEMMDEVMREAGIGALQWEKLFVMNLFYSFPESEKVGIDDLGVRVAELAKQANGLDKEKFGKAINKYFTFLREDSGEVSRAMMDKELISDSMEYLVEVVGKENLDMDTINKFLERKKASGVVIDEPNP
jgi:hypothetical protein